MVDVFLISAFLAVEMSSPPRAAPAPPRRSPGCAGCEDLGTFTSASAGGRPGTSALAAASALPGSGGTALGRAGGTSCPALGPVALAVAGAVPGPVAVAAAVGGGRSAALWRWGGGWPWRLLREVWLFPPGPL